jgi:hypothetical protein
MHQRSEQKWAKKRITLHQIKKNIAIMFVMVQIVNVNVKTKSVTFLKVTKVQIVRLIQYFSNRWRSYAKKLKL